MIQLAQNDLSRKLDAIQAKSNPEDPKQAANISREYDFALTGAWQGLRNTEALDAIEILLSNMEAEIVNHLIDPRVPADGRSFLSGQLRVVNEIQAGIKRFMTLDPNEIDYEAEQEANQFGDPDVQDGYEGDDKSAAY